MKEIVIISGKGGTGKTSVTGSLAVLAGNAVIADCDVDASDLHLLLNPIQTKSHDFMSGHEAVIDPEICISCGKCFELCRFDAIDSTDGVFRVKPIGCEGCGVCVKFCPADAISFPESHCGEWFHSQTVTGSLFHARLKAGAENSGKLVSTVRSEAKKWANQHGIDLIIADGPPGIGCPVISSITGTNLAVIVTEPTLSGKHDLERVLKLTKHFRVKSLVIINKWDLNESLSLEIETTAKLHGSEVIGQLPYSPVFNKAQNTGVPVVVFAPESREAIELKSIWEEIKRQLNEC